VQDCGNLPENDGRKSVATYATYVNYQYLSGLARGCGLPASTVTLTLPTQADLSSDCKKAQEQYTALKT
jgi:hypothetical protein